MKFRSELRARYPAILERASLSYGPGWAGLLEALCERLQNRADHGKQAVQITQAKEKWGELSVNYMGRDFYADGVIDMAEAMSAHICELCGNLAVCSRDQHSARGAASILTVEMLRIISNQGWTTSTGE